MKLNLVFLLGLSVCCAQALAQDATITNLKDMHEVKANATTFTGNAYVKNLFDASALGHSYAALVRFEPGARTYYHSHPRGQVLIVTAGEGYVQNKDGTLQHIVQGDVVICPNDTFHFHGATADSPMTHLAISEVEPGRKVTWAEEVKEIK